MCNTGDVGESPSTFLAFSPTKKSCTSSVVSSSDEFSARCASVSKAFRASRAFSELHQTKGGDNEKSEERIRASGYKFVPVQGKKVGISTTGTSDSEKVLVQKIVLKKAGKIQQYKKNFRKVGLAILFPETPSSYAEDHCLEWVTEVLNNFQESFDFVYVLSHRFCIYYEIQKNVSEKRCFTENVYKSLSTIARMTAEGQLSLTDPEWL